mmetsp:Transcript_21786/g.43303  ORF Transcript_21786/g.43303 Transcript_21786/m.43303 type:complete len:685 (-) Transcript_21786:226-2280(-)
MRVGRVFGGFLCFVGAGAFVRPPRFFTCRQEPLRTRTSLHRAGNGDRSESEAPERLETASLARGSRRNALVRQAGLGVSAAVSAVSSFSPAASAALPQSSDPGFKWTPEWASRKIKSQTASWDLSDVVDAIDSSEHMRLSNGEREMVLNRKAMAELSKKDLRDADFILLGEDHQNWEDHAVQLMAIEYLTSIDRDANWALGLEMCLASQQSILDDYTGSSMPFAQVVQNLDWDNTWRYDPQMYYPIFDYAKNNGIRLVGLNIPEVFVSLVAQSGYDDLQQTFPMLPWPQMVLDVPEHKKYFVQGVAESHGLNNLDNMYQAYTLWEESMAERAASWFKFEQDAIYEFERFRKLRSQRRWGERKEVPRSIAECGAGLSDRLARPRMIVMAGRRHVGHHSGLADRILRRLVPEEKLTKASFKDFRGDIERMEKEDEVEKDRKEAGVWGLFGQESPEQADRKSNQRIQALVEQGFKAKPEKLPLPKVRTLARYDPTETALTPGSVLSTLDWTFTSEPKDWPGLVAYMKKSKSQLSRELSLVEKREREARRKVQEMQARQKKLLEQAAKGQMPGGGRLPDPYGGVEDDGGDGRGGRLLPEQMKGQSFEARGPSPGVSSEGSFELLADLRSRQAQTLAGGDREGGVMRPSAALREIAHRTPLSGEKGAGGEGWPSVAGLGPLKSRAAGWA